MKKRYRLQPVRELRDQIRQEAARVVALRREQLAAAPAGSDDRSNFISTAFAVL